MRQISIVSAIVVLVAAFSLASCTKAKEDKLGETWRLVLMEEDSTVTWLELWQFDGEKLMITKRPEGSTNLDTLAVGTYSVKSGLSKTIVTVNDCNYDLYNGDWEVLTLNKEMLVMLNRTDGDFIYREFMKE
jgi:hypothetical protein